MFSLFVVLYSLGISSNIPIDYLCKVWDFLEQFGCIFFYFGEEDLGAGPANRPVQQTGLAAFTIKPGQFFTPAVQAAYPAGQAGSAASQGATQPTRRFHGRPGRLCQTANQD